MGWINLDADGQLFTDTISRPDTDGDGLGEIWELAYAGNLTSLDATSDPDGDGRSNTNEYFDATNPFATDNTISPTLIPVTGGEGLRDFQITWLGNGLRSYLLQNEIESDFAAKVESQFEKMLQTATASPQ